MAPSDADESKHVTIANQLRRAIESGEYPVGSEMPSESALARQFRVSRGTIRNAMASLRIEGLVRTSRGRRPVVHPQPLEHALDDFFSFSSWVRAQGRIPGQRTLEISRRRRTEAESEVPLGYPDSEYLVHVVRLRLIDGRPTMVERSAFDDSIGQLLLELDPDSGSIYEFLLQQGANLDEGTHVIDAVPANALDAELLHVDPCEPILRVRRVTTSASGTVLEYSEDRYRPDRAAVRVRNSRATASSPLRGAQRTVDPAFPLSASDAFSPNAFP